MTPAMNTDLNKSTYRRFIQDVFNEGHLEEIDDLLAPDYTLHDAPPGTPAGREGVKQIVARFRAAYPDMAITIEDQVAEEDRVCSRSTLRATHKGEIFSVRGTGKAVTMTSSTMVRIKGDESPKAG